MTLGGLPLHPLVVHAAVVLAPLAALVALAHTLVPRWRWALRHVAAVSVLMAAVSVQFAAMTGDALAESETSVGKLVRLHEMWAGRLQFAVWVLAAAGVAAWWVTPHQSPLANHSRTERDSPLAPVLHRVALILVPAAAVATLALVALTGHAGAEAVWARG